MLSLLFLLAIHPSLSTSHAQTKGPAVGELAPQFRIADRWGNLFSLDTVRAQNRGTVVFFWALRCASCLREMAHLDEINLKYKTKGVAIVGVESNGSSYEAITEMLEKMRQINLQPSYAILADPNGNINADYGIKEVPATFLLNRDGIVVLRLQDYSGEHKTALEVAIEELLGLRVPLPPPTETRHPAPGTEVPDQPQPPPLDIAAEAPSIRESLKAERTAPPPDKEDEFEKNRYFGDFYYQKQEFDKARDYYDKCLAIHPKNTYVKLKLGELFARKRNFSRARELWEEILKDEPGNVEADYNIRRLIRGDF